MRHPMQQPMSHSWPAVVPARPGDSLLGRRTELADLRRRLGSARLVTLWGQSGIGKSSLARAAAAARTLLATQSYAPPLTSSGPRDQWCAAHHDDAPPLPYDFGPAAPYGY